MTGPKVDISSPVEGLARALELTSRDRSSPPPTAMCPRCPDAVLVSTLLFSGAEFYCLECGATVGFLSPRAEASSAELDARAAAAGEEFRRLVLHSNGEHRADAYARLDKRRTR